MKSKWNIQLQPATNICEILNLLRARHMAKCGECFPRTDWEGEDDLGRALAPPSFNPGEIADHSERDLPNHLRTKIQGRIPPFLFEILKMWIFMSFELWSINVFKYIKTYFNGKSHFCKTQWFTDQKLSSPIYLPFVVCHPASVTSPLISSIRCF